MKTFIIACVFACFFVTTNAAISDTTHADNNTRDSAATAIKYGAPKINENNPVMLKTSGLPDNANTENNVMAKIMNDIQQSLDRKNKMFDSTMLKLDKRVGKLDSLIKVTGNPRERFDRLVERVQVLEEKQKAVEQNEINVYEANYQSAIINLVSMDREIKPLYLFHATKDFFNTLTETSNPTSYDEFRKGFENFRVYIDKVKESNATQKAVSEVIGGIRVYNRRHTYCRCLFPVNVLQYGRVCKFYRPQKKRIESRSGANVCHYRSAQPVYNRQKPH